MKIWYDITNTPQVHFIIALKNSLSFHIQHQCIITSREFCETNKLLKQKTTDKIIIISEHKGKSKSKKFIGLISRFYKSYRIIKNFDISISCGSEDAVWNSFLRGVKSIAFGDNDLAKQWTYGIFVSNAFFPDAIDKNILIRQGIKRDKLYQYHGYKEDVYLADYVPDENFMDQIPFEQYIVVRPENLQANYINNDKVKTITPKLLRELSNSGYNILYLPRYKIDKEYAKGIDRVFIPDKPVNGLDACYFADAVLTGAGTFAREAACLGIPAFSFFAGRSLLAVDKALIGENKMFWSRDINEIMSSLKKSKKQNIDLSRCKVVQDEVISKLVEVIQSW